MKVANATVSIQLTRTRNGLMSCNVTNPKGKLHVIRQPGPWSLTAGFGERVRDITASLLPLAS